MRKIKFIGTMINIYSVQSEIGEKNWFYVWRSDLIETMQECDILRNQKIFSSPKEWGRAGWSLRLPLASKFCDILTCMFIKCLGLTWKEASENRGREWNCCPIMHHAS